MIKGRLGNSTEYSNIKNEDDLIMGASFWRKLRKRLVDLKWILVGLGWLVSLVLGYIGFDRYFDAVGEMGSFWDKLYPSLQLFVLQSGQVSGPIGWEL